MPDGRDNLPDIRRRLCAGDPRALEDFVRRYLDPVVAATARFFDESDAHLVHDGTVDAILDFCAHPEAFDPHGQASLERFLLNAARGHAANLIVAERRLNARERRAAKKNPEISVALDPAAHCISIEEQNRQAAAIEEILAPLNDRDRAFFKLYLDGVRETASFAQILQIEDRPIAERRAEVKRHKSRIRGRLKRKGLLP